MQVFYDGFQKHGWDGGNYMVDPDHWGLIAKRGKGGLWRVTYGDVGGLTDERLAFREDTPRKPKTQTNMYKIHNRCADKFRVGRILLAADAAQVCNPMGGYGCMTAVLDVNGIADCLIGYYEGKAGEEILDRYAEARRDIFLRYIDKRSIRNLEKVAKSDPMTVFETDKFFQILKDLEKDEEARRAFLLVSLQTYDPFLIFSHTCRKLPA
jgi:2-polyprenyl-6-methoxyphenol hydroxylase-like FAD-dependent oxidoreductase